MSSKRQQLVSKMLKLQDELEKLEKYNREQVGKILLEMYDKNEIDSEKIKLIIAKVLGEEKKDKSQTAITE
jgi:hypothetical protein